MKEYKKKMFSLILKTQALLLGLGSETDVYILDIELNPYWIL